MSSGARHTAKKETPLQGWKDIGAYLQRTERTAKRWEAKEGLPVHRHRHATGITVYAYPSELDAWRAQREPEAESTRSAWLRPVSAFGSIIVIALALMMAGSGPQAGPAMAADGSEIVLRRIWDGPESDFSGHPSPDGRYITLGWEAGSDLAVRDIETGETRLLEKSEKPLEMALRSVWSPSGDRIAYCWYRGGKTAELRIIRPDGTGKRTLDLGADEYPEPRAWFPNGREILATVNKGLARISVASGAVKVLTNLEKNRGKFQRATISPAGDYVAYAYQPSEQSSQHDIYMLPADGGREVSLIKHPADDRLLGWPDAEHILFLSDRSGSYDIWSLPVSDGHPAAAPQLLCSDTGLLQPLGMTTDGRFLFGKNTTMHDVYVASLDLDSGTWLSPPARATERFVGGTTYPEWSPEGRQLAYVVHRGALYERSVDKIRIQELAGGSERELPLQFLRIKTFRWSPDGRTLMVVGLWRDARRTGLYRIDVQTGSLEPTIEYEYSGHTGKFFQDATWSRDGKSVFYSARSRWPWKGWIAKRDLDSGQETMLRSMPYFHNPVCLALSPDGRELAFAMTAVLIDGEYQPSAVMVMPASGGEPRELAQDDKWGIVRNSVNWTPDGRHVVYAKRSEGMGGRELWRVSPVGGEPEQVGFLKMPSVGTLRLHPDGKRVAFDSGNPRGEIWVMENFLPKSQAAE